MTNSKDQLLDAAENQPKASDSQLREVSRLIRLEREAQEQLDTAEAIVRDTKGTLHQLRMTDIPNAMHEANTAGFTDAETGLTVSLDFVSDGGLGSARNEEEEAERNRKIDIIVEHGGGEIVKMVVSASFRKEDKDKADELLAELEERGFSVSIERSIHGSTLKKWIKERMEAGDNLPLDDLGIWYGQKAVVKEKKK